MKASTGATRVSRRDVVRISNALGVAAAGWLGLGASFVTLEVARHAAGGVFLFAGTIALLAVIVISIAQWRAFSMLEEAERRSATARRYVPFGWGVVALVLLLIEGVVAWHSGDTGSNNTIAATVGALLAVFLGLTVQERLLRETSGRFPGVRFESLRRGLHKGVLHGTWAVPLLWVLLNGGCIFGFASILWTVLGLAGMAFATTMASTEVKRASATLG